jgi:antirestriction factor ArdC-like protein
MATADARALSSERVSAIAHDILAAFESGELPKALAQLFIHRKVDVPSRAWTWTNRLIAIRRGHVYAAGFRQWQEAGRYVKKGEHAFHILAPRITKAKEDDEGRGVKEGDPVTLGFLAVPVFGYLQTEGEPLAGVEDAPEFIDRLPCIEVAHTWGLSVSLYSIDDAPDRLGYFSPGRGIALGVENLSTWAHELIHAADHRLGNLVARSLDAEVVAEFGGAILLECLGYSAESDRGGAYEYLKRHCEKAKRSLLGACTELLDRTCGCITLLLDEAEIVTRHGFQEEFTPAPAVAARLA